MNNRFRKGTGMLILAAAILMLLFPGYADEWEEPEDGNLLYNGDFEIIDDETGLPEGWIADEYHPESGLTVFSTETDQEGLRGNIAVLQNIESNDARFAQDVYVQPNTVYCLSGFIQADGVEDGHGANFSVEGLYTFSEQIYETGGDWEYVEYYGRTGADQDWVRIYVRLGGYSGESTGTAKFDDLCMAEAEIVPDGYTVANWYIPNETDNSGDMAEEEEDKEKDYNFNKYWYELQNDPKENSRIFLIITGIGWLALFLAVANWFKGRRRSLSFDSRKELIYFLPVLAAAFAARLIISYHVEGYAVDVGCFTAWGSTMDAQGPFRFYNSTSFCDYPPLYMYILGQNSLIARWTGSSAEWTRVIYRLVPCLCDVLSCWLIYGYARKKMPEQIHRVCAVMILLALNPATMLNSAAWGQIDSVLCLLLIMVALCAAEEKWQAAIPIYAVSALVKPQALMLGILGLTYMIITWIRKKESRKPMLTGLGIGIAAIAAIVLPFSAGQEISWITELYANTLKSYPYATVNTANLYYLLGGNWSSIETAAPAAAPLLLALGTGVYAAWWYIRNREKAYSWIETTLSCDFCVLFLVLTAMNASWGTVGTIAMIFAFMVTLSFAIRHGDIGHLPYLGALLFILLFVFGVKMHERYLFPALFLLACAWAIRRDRRILYLLGLFTMTMFINEGIVLDNSIRLGSEYGHLRASTTAIADVLALLNIGGAIYAVILARQLTEPENESSEKYTGTTGFPKRDRRKRNPLDFRPDRKLHWSRTDTIILSVITVIFSVISLTTLGSTRAPQNGWTSSGADEEIIFDLGKEHEDIRILYFGRVSYYDFSFAQSKDGVNWSSDNYAQMNEGQCWKWKYVVESSGSSGGTRTYYESMDQIIHFQGRYIKLKARSADLRLNEVIFRDRDGNNIPATVLSRTGGNPASSLYSDPENLLDEQDTLEELPSMSGRESGNTGAQPSWWNSTYFDEIYHPRTAYEFLHSDEIKVRWNAAYPETYENSHPPLGKVLMSASVAIFGMTPFGWRFAGALAGILMLPGMYLLGKQLTKKTTVAALVCALMALDCMHLTQTQIGTIDSFPVLFIMFAFFFMLRYIQTDIVKASLKESLVPLGLSGLFIGLAIASKWIGLYAGVGLAVLFFWHGFRMIRISRQAREMIDSGTLTAEERAYVEPYVQQTESKSQPVMRKLFIISHWCILFFIAVPIGIYLLSYIPFMACRSDLHSLSDYIKAVWQSQINMYNYHSTPGLGMDHAYYSPWYQWPVMAKPMFYANRMYLPAKTGTPYSIYAFGNPAVWWGALCALAYCILCWLKTHCWRTETGYELPMPGDRYARIRQKNPIHLTARTYDNSIPFVLIALMAEYLPWVLVPRGTYIYHYFASVPFIILCIGLALERGSEETRNRRLMLGAVVLLTALAAFIIFFPYASGIPAPRSWLNIGAVMLRITY